MKATFITTGRGIWASIQKSVRINGKSTTITIKKLGLLEDIKKEYGCDDPRQWVTDLAAKMTQEEKEGKEVITLDFYPAKDMTNGEIPLRNAGDLFLLPNFYKLGLADWCDKIMKKERAKYDLSEIVRTLVTSRVLFPCSKLKTVEQSKSMVEVPDIREEQMYKALSLLSSHMDDLQALVWKNSQNIMERNTRVIFYDCTNYFFETEDNDPDMVDIHTGEFIPGLRKRGKSKEHRPNPIVQMGLLMDADGIPLSFIIFPGNESEQPTLQKIEEMVAHKFGLNEFIISTDAGLSSEDNRRYNMTEGRDYIAVQSLPSLPEEDQKVALDPNGWHILWRNPDLDPIDEENPDRDIFDLDEIDFEKEPDTRLYKEIMVDKMLKGQKKSARPERIIVTYSHKFALYLKAKREERLRQAEKIVKKGLKKSRQSQQDPRRYVSTKYVTEDGEVAENISMSIDTEVVETEKKFDGFYAYGTSLDDEAVDVLKARSFHHEIEHLFRTTKTHLDARPVYLQRQDRIKSHFLVCFLAMVLLNMLSKQLRDSDKKYFMRNPFSIDTLIETIRNFKFGLVKGGNYIPMYATNDLNNKLQDMLGLELNKEIIKNSKMRATYRKVKKS